MRTFDVAVVGGGPAGLGVALEARLQGMSVVVLDGQVPPVDKACGEGLMPGAVAALRRLGVGVEGVEFAGIRFVGAGKAVEGEFPGQKGVGVRRVELHRAMVRAAEKAGVECGWGVAVRGLDQLGVSARWVVGADGAMSAVRRWAGLEQWRSEKRRYASRVHYAVEPWTRMVEVHWGKGAQAYVTPVGAREVGVAVVAGTAEVARREVWELFPELGARLREAEVVSRRRGAVTATSRLRRVATGNVALVGDASGMVDAVTGDGIALALEQGRALVEHLGNWGAYAREHARVRRQAALMAEMILLMDRSEWVQRKAMGALAGRPELFGRLLEMHVEGFRAPAFVGTALRLGWQMLV